MPATGPQKTLYPLAPIVSTALSLLPLAFTFVLYAVLIKLAARLYGSSLLPWKHAFAFGALAMLVGGIGALLNYASGFLLGPLLGVVLGLAVQLALGGWYLGPRAFAPTGEAVAFKGGALIAAIGLGVVFALGVVAAVVIPLLNGSSQSVGWGERSNPQRFLQATAEFADTASVARATLTSYC